MKQDRKFYEDFFAKFPVGIHDSPDRFLAVSSLLHGRVLDLACGTGTLSDYYAGEYVGVDWSSEAIRKAVETRRKDASFFVRDLETEPFLVNNRFDCAYVGEFLEHIENDDAIFQNLLRCLSPSARIVVTVPNGDRVPDESHCRVFTVPQIRRDYSKYGRVSFHNWPGERDRILFTIDLSLPPNDEVTLVMIAKDEEKGIERALLSSIAFVDKVIVSVDSKTTDRTKEIAALYADEVKEHVWQDDFSAARNFAQQGVTSKWILFLDGHEYIQEQGKIASYLESDVEGIFVTVKMETGMTFLFPRIYRSHIQFKGKVHNLNECKTQRACPDFLIIHDRENGQDAAAIARRNAQREEMLPRVMEDTLKQNPRSLRALFHLGNWYLMRHDIPRAMSYYRRYMRYSTHAEEAYMVAVNLVYCHAALGHNFRALYWSYRADRLLPGRSETARMVGGLYATMGMYRTALPWLVQALQPNTRRYLYQPMQINFVELWDLIGLCFTNTDQYVAAVAAYERAITHCNDDQQKALFAKKIELLRSLYVDSKN